MARTVAAVFSDYTHADRAIRKLLESGFRTGDMSVIATDREGIPATIAAEENKTTNAGTGAAMGGATGLMLGLAALAIPGIGPIVAAGPLAAALTAAGVGAAAGGVLGALTRAGVPEGHAGAYETALARGGTLVAIQVDEDKASEAENILQSYGAIDIKERRPNDWQTPDPHNQAENYGDEGGHGEWGHRELDRGAELAPGRTNLGVNDAEQGGAPDTSDPQVVGYYQSSWRNRCTWEEFRDAWRFGHGLGTTGRYASAHWADVETDARAHWEARSPNTWDKMREIVRHAWEHVRGSR